MPALDERAATAGVGEVAPPSIEVRPDFFRCSYRARATPPFDAQHVSPCVRHEFFVRCVPRSRLVPCRFGFLHTLTCVGMGLEGASQSKFLVDFD